MKTSLILVGFVGRYMNRKMIVLLIDEIQDILLQCIQKLNSQRMMLSSVSYLSYKTITLLLLFFFNLTFFSSFPKTEHWFLTFTFRMALLSSRLVKSQAIALPCCASSGRCQVEKRDFPKTKCCVGRQTECSF